MNVKYILLIALLFALFYFMTENAQAGFGSDCRPCHEKLGQLTSPHIDEDCKGCHNWAEQHVKPDICSRCHSSNIHDTHKGVKECSFCHNPPRNFSSPRVKIPYAGSTDPEGILIPPSKECTYCHNINTGGGSLHAIHSSNLPNICSKCHLTEMNKQSITTVTKTLRSAEKSAKAEITLLQDLSRLFNEIASIIASIFGA